MAPLRRFFRLCGDFAYGVHAAHAMRLGLEPPSRSRRKRRIADGVHWSDLPSAPHTRASANSPGNRREPA